MRTAEALMVTPFSRSKSIESRICSVVSRSGTVPVRCRKRSARVDLPWSIWAIMQKLRMWAVGDWSGMGGSAFPVGEGRSRMHGEKPIRDRLDTLTSIAEPGLPAGSGEKGVESVGLPRRRRAGARVPGDSSGHP